MANINDTNNTTEKLEKQWEILQQADIDNQDRQAIRDFVRLERQGNQNRKRNTLISDLSTLRMASKRADVPLIEMDMGNVRELLGRLTTPKGQGGYGLDPEGSGTDGYKRALKIFFRWLDEQPDYGEFPFYENIDISSQTVSRVDEDQLLDEDDIEALKVAANNPRDKALIEFLADTGARISMASQLRVQDIYDLDTDRPYYMPNPNGVGHKGAPDKRYPILYSRAELRAYLNRHHIDPQPEAPLWHVLSGYDSDNPEDGAISGDGIRSMLGRCKRDTDVEKPVNPHNFRHTALTRLSKTGHSPQEIQHVAGWVDDTMLDAYDHTSDIERNEQLRARAGLIDEAQTPASPPTPKACGNCREDLHPEARFCPNCGAATTPEAREAVEDQDDRMFESAARADPELANDVRWFRELLNDRPQLRAVLLNS